MPRRPLTHASAATGSAIGLFTPRGAITITSIISILLIFMKPICYFDRLPYGDSLYFGRCFYQLSRAALLHHYLAPQAGKCSRSIFVLSFICRAFIYEGLARYRLLYISGAIFIRETLRRAGFPLFFCFWRLIAEFRDFAYYFRRFLLGTYALRQIDIKKFIDFIDIPIGLCFTAPEMPKLIFFCYSYTSGSRLLLPYAL